MTLTSAILWSLLALAAVVLLCFSASWLEKQKHETEFDERQIMARLQASNLSQWVGLTYFFISMMVMIHQVDNPKTVEPFLLVYFGFFLMLTVYETYCIIHQASVPLSRKPVSLIISMILSGIISFWCVTITMKKDGPLTLTGHGTSGWIYLVPGMFSFYTAVLMTIQHLRRNKE